MPQITLDITLDDLAKVIASMGKRDLETLLILITDEGKELLKRKQDIESKEVKTLSREEVFDVQIQGRISSAGQKRPEEN